MPRTVETLGKMAVNLRMSAVSFQNDGQLNKAVTDCNSSLSLAQKIMEKSNSTTWKNRHQKLSKLCQQLSSALEHKQP